MSRDCTGRPFNGSHLMYSPRLFGDPILIGMQKQQQQQLNKMNNKISNLTNLLQEQKKKLRKAGTSSGIKTLKSMVVQKAKTSTKMYNLFDNFGQTWKIAQMSAFDPRARGICPAYLLNLGYQPYNYKYVTVLTSPPSANFMAPFMIRPNPCVSAIFNPNLVPVGGSTTGALPFYPMTDGGYILTDYSSGAPLDGTTGLSGVGTNYIILSVGYRKRSVLESTVTAATIRGATVSDNGGVPYPVDYFKGASTPNATAISSGTMTAAMSGYNMNIIDTEQLPGAHTRFTTTDITEQCVEYNFRPTGPEAYKVRLTTDQGTTLSGSYKEYDMVEVNPTTGLISSMSGSRNSPTSCDGWTYNIHQYSNLSASTTYVELEMTFHLAIAPVAPALSSTYCSPTPSAPPVNPGTFAAASDLFRSAVKFGGSAIEGGIRFVDAASRLRRDPARTLTRLMIANNMR